jgi:hypothetical protein
MDPAVREKLLNKLATEIMALSVLLILVGTIWSWRVGLSANEVDHRLYHASENLIGLRHNVARMRMEVGR